MSDAPAISLIVAVYQRAGFVPYRQETRIIPDPRLPGAMPPGQEFR